MAIVGLVACQAASPTLAPSSTPMPTSTSAAAVPTATPAGEATADAAPQWQIPRVQETDWGEGTPGAGLVVVEYSDFQ